MTFPITTGTSLILADHYNSIRNTLFDIIGPGQDGYGLIRLESSEVDARYVVKANERKFIPGWKNLIYFLDAVQVHQTGQKITYNGTTLTDIILFSPTNDITSGVKVSASLTNFLYSKSQELLATRFQVDSSQLLTVENLNGESLRTSDWGYGTIEPVIDHVVEATWVSIEEMRSFFNLGGYVSIDIDHLDNASDTTSTQWKNLIDSINELTYTRTDYLGSEVKYYPVASSTRVDPDEGTLYMSVHVTAVRDQVEPKITFKISFNDLPDLNVNFVDGPSLVLIPPKDRWFVDQLGSSDLTAINIPPILEDSGLEFDDQNYSEDLVTLQFDNDGTFEIVSTGGRANFAAAWGTPVRPNNGNNYWIKFDRLSTTGTGFYSVESTTGWQQLTQRRSVSVRSSTQNYSGDSNAQATYQVRISSSSSGSPVLAVGTYTLIAKSIGNVFVPVNELAYSGETFNKSVKGAVGVGVLFDPNGRFYIGYISREDDYLTRNFEVFKIDNWGTPPAIVASLGQSVDTFILSESGIDNYSINVENPGNRYWLNVERVQLSESGSGTSLVTSSTGWLSLSQYVTVQATSIAKGRDSRITTATFDIKIAEDSQGTLIVSTATYTFVSESKPLG